VRAEYIPARIAWPSASRPRASRPRHGGSRQSRHAPLAARSAGPLSFILLAARRGTRMHHLAFTVFLDGCGRGNVRAADRVALQFAGFAGLRSGRCPRLGMHIQQRPEASARTPRMERSKADEDDSGKNVEDWLVPWDGAPFRAPPTTSGYFFFFGGGAFGFT